MGGTLKTATREINGEIVEVQIIDEDFYRENADPERDEEIEFRFETGSAGHDAGRAYMRNPTRGVE